MLRLLHEFKDQVNLVQVEAIMIGAAKYWKDGSIIKRIRGHYAAVEVWAVYMHYLEQHQGEY